MGTDPYVTTMAAIACGFAVIDGDTVHREHERYRLLGIDAAEIHRAQCDAKQRLGKLTKARLEALLQSGPVELRPDKPGERDKYRAGRGTKPIGITRAPKARSTNWNRT